jgi:DNA mismatch endonuclease (patch repair protein)
MQAVRSKDTKPEMVIRKIVHALGYRYRLHKPDLPGKPDLAFVNQRKVVFVHGCFWHGHECRWSSPVTNAKFWADKIVGNKRRDRRAVSALEATGWTVLTIWECEIKNHEKVTKRLTSFLDKTSK